MGSADFEVRVQFKPSHSLGALCTRAAFAF